MFTGRTSMLFSLLFPICLTVNLLFPGYGSVYPVTRPGRIATMFYATVGVPLFLLTMGKFGKLFTRGVKYCAYGLNKLYYLEQMKCVRKSKIIQKITGKKNSEEENISYSRSAKSRRRKSKARSMRQISLNDDTSSYISFHIDDEFNLHPLVAIIITLVYILIGSFMYVQWEKHWAYYDAFYFIFISVSTIGFGDLVPQHPKFFLLSSIYILFGLALVAMVITVLMEFFDETLETVVEQLPDILITEDDEEDEENKKNIQAGLQHLAVNFQPEEQVN